MFFERNLSGIDVILRIKEYQSPEKHEYGDWWCDCDFSFRMGKLAEFINYRSDNNELLTPEEIDDLAICLTDLLDGKIVDPKVLTMLEPDFAFILYPKGHQFSEIDNTLKYLDVSVEWRVYFWDDGLTDNFLAVTLYRDDIEALRDYLNSVRKK